MKLLPEVYVYTTWEFKSDADFKTSLSIRQDSHLFLWILMREQTINIEDTWY